VELRKGIVTSLYWVELRKGLVTSLYWVELRKGLVTSLYWVELRKGLVASLYWVEFWKVSANIAHLNFSGRCSIAGPLVQISIIYENNFSCNKIFNKVLYYCSNCR
jgi:hypothetical protein